MIYFLHSRSMKKNTKVIFILILLSGILSIFPNITDVFCEEDSLSSLREGKKLLDMLRYDDALPKLKIAYKELPVIGDYTLFFIAEAYSKARSFDDSNHSISELLQSYPDSLLKKRAKALQIRNTISGEEIASRKNLSDGILQSLEQYTNDYPEDTEMTFLLGRLLKNHGQTVRADKIFKQIYIASNSYSEPAYKELLPSDITADDMLSKASNLIKAAEYKKAESVLRKTLLNCGCSLKDEIHKKLGTALFRQKRYKEAVGEFLAGGDIYNASLSMYRAGEIDAFSKTVSRLVSMEDSRAGGLLSAFASRKRRDGKKEEALEIYNSIKNKYPSRAEDAMWGIAWTYYRNAEYENALDMLTVLNNKYHNSKYPYWMARSIDNSAKEGEHKNGGISSDSIYRQIKSNNRNFYGLMAQAIDKEQTVHLKYLQFTKMQEPSAHSDVCSIKATKHLQGLNDNSSARQLNSDSISNSLERFNILMELGMKEEAISELVHTSRRVSDTDAVLYLSVKLHEAGAYKKAMSIISQLNPQSKMSQYLAEDSEFNINYILYPLAYWPVVVDVSNRYNLDPLVLLSVMREESRYDPNIRSIAGALGLMQIMPQTAYNLNVELKMNITDKAMIHDIRTNITIGAYYLNTLLKEFASLPAALAAYNAGEERVRSWLKEGNYKSVDEFIEDIPYDETKNYVKHVLMTYNTYKQQALKCMRDTTN